MSSNTTGPSGDPPARDPRDPDLVTTAEELKAVMRVHYEQARNAPGLSFQDLSRHRSAGDDAEAIIRRALEDLRGAGAPA